MKKLVSLIAAISVTAAFTPAVLAAPVATVNGKEITQKQYESYLQQRGAGQKTPVNRQMVINELISRELLLQEAANLKLEKDKKVKYELEMARKNLLIKNVIARSPVAQPITDKELKDEYNAKIKQANVNELKARHILVKDEAKAKEIIEKLNKGSDFAELAKKESTGPSGKNGGDLGWFSPQQMVPEFSQAASKMKKGTHSKTPVKTQFGWHVIKLEDTRKLEPPKFDAVKKQISSIIQNQRLQKYLETLHKKSKVVINK